MKLRPLLAAPALAALLVAGCGSGSSHDPSGPPSSVTDTTTMSTTGPGAPPVKGSAGLRLDDHGLGPVRVGMTLEQAARALGRPLVPVTSPTEACTMYAPTTGFDGLSFLVAAGTVARADVTAGPTATVEGMAIGQTEAEAQQHYGNRLRVNASDFQLGGHYLTLAPSGPDTGYRLVAETDGVRVTAMRAGRLPEVEFTEGCS